MAEKQIPGLQLAVVKSSKLIKTANYGLGNLQDDIKVDDDTLFNIASITKVFTGVVLMQLVEQGKLDMSASITDYLPDLPLAWQPIKIKHLVTHSSGLPNVLTRRMLPISNEGEDASLALVKAKPLLFQPQSQFNYNQTGHVLLARIIEKVSGQTYDELITKHQLQTVKMNRTQQGGFAHFESVIPHVARDYSYSEVGEVNNLTLSFPKFIRSGAGMSSTAKELARYIIALQDGKLLKKSSSLATLWSPIALDGGKLEQGHYPHAYYWLAVERENHPAMVAPGGASAVMAVYPKDDLSIVVLTNLNGADPFQFIDKLAAYYIPQMNVKFGFGLPADTKALWQKLELVGYDKAADVANGLVNDSAISLDAKSLNHFAYWLYEQGKIDKAMAIYKLNNHLFANQKIANKALEQYVGEYVFPDYIVEVTSERGQLFMQIRNQQKNLLLGDSIDAFTLQERSFQMPVTFERDKHDSVISFTFHLDDNEKYQGKKSIN